MKTQINNDLRVFMVLKNNGKSAFCNIEQLNEAVQGLQCIAGYFKIYHFESPLNKQVKTTKKDLAAFFEGSQLKQEFHY
jgi:hypothetical protein